jgi:Lon-like protease
MDRKPVRLPVILWLVAVVALSLVAIFLPLPYYSLSPGPAREVEPLIHIRGVQTFPTQGRLVMTTVEFRQLTLLGSAIAWLDPNQQVVSKDVLFEPGESQQAEQQRSISEMDSSKISASAVALHAAAGYPKERGTGALIDSVVGGCAAEGRLFAGDLIGSIDGRKVADAAAAGRLIHAAPAGEKVRFDVTPLGETKDQRVNLVRRPCGGSSRPLVGITMVDDFPFDIRIESGEIGGPSAGLMFALGVYDLLTPGDLTGGRTIAGTGTIDSQGAVGPIGGIQDKVVAAERAGATVLLVPAANYDKAREAASGDLHLVSVGSFDDALRYLGASPSGSGSKTR